MHFNITKQIGVVLFVPLFGALIALAVFFSYLTETRSDGAFLNIAGHQRMLSEQLRAWTHMVRIGQKDVRDGLRERIRLFDHALKVLEHGGVVMERTLPPTPPEVLDELEAVKSHWAVVKPALSVIAVEPGNDPKARAAYDKAHPHIEQLTSSANQVVTAYENKIQQLRNRMFTALKFIAGIDLFILLLGIWTIGNYDRERRQTEKRISNKFQAQKVLRSILQISLQPISLEKQLGQILDVLLSVPWLDIQSKGCIFLHDEASAQLSMTVQRGIDDPVLNKCSKVPIGQCLCGQAAATRKIVFADCVDHRHEILFDNMPPHGHICMPIVSGNELLGVMNFYVEHGYIRNLKEEKFLDMVVDTLAGIIKHQNVLSVLQRQAQIIDQVHDSVVATDPDGFVTNWNKGSERLFGYTNKEMIGRHISTLYPVEEHEFLQQQVIAPLKAQGGHEVEVRMYRKNGDNFYALLALSQLLNEKGEVTGMIGYSIDITERKQAHSELQRRELQQAAVAELGQHVLVDINLDTLLDRAVGLVAGILRVEYCKILELLPDNQTFLLRAAEGWDEDETGKVTVNAGTDPQASYTLTSDKPVVIRDLSSETRFKAPPLLTEQGIVCGVSITIQGTNRPYGVIGVHTREHRVFTDDEINFLRMIANILSHAVERKRREESMRKLAEGMSATASQSFFESLVENLAKTLDVDFALVAKIDMDTPKISKTVAVYAKGEIIDNLEYDLDGTPCHNLMEGKLCYYPDSLQEHFPTDKMLVDMNINSYMGIPLFNSAGQILGLMVVMSNETLGEIDFAQSIIQVFSVRAALELERANDEEKLQKSEARHRNLVETTNDWIWEVNENAIYTYASPQVKDLLGYEPAEVLGKTPFDLMPRHEAERVTAIFSSITSKQEPFTALENTNQHKDGHLVVLETSGIPFYDGNGTHRGYRGIDRDITARKEDEQRLEYLAHYDQLTKLANRALFFDRLDQALARARWHQHDVAVMFLDLDRFKVINDTLGHDTGDLVLKEVAERLLGLVRDGDTVARLGGDEFSIILVDIAALSDIPYLAQSILGALEKPLEIEGREFFVTTSIGISCHPDDGDNGKVLVANADIAMYHAKEQGRNNYQFYSSNMDDKAAERLALETRLRPALERGEFQLHYQPKVDLGSGQMCGMEALVRWQPPGDDLISPIKFIPLLEDTGMIVAVGEWILHTACAQTKAWHEAGFSKLRVSVNLSPRQFKGQGLVEMVLRVLERTRLEPQYLELEITESILMEYQDQTTSALNQLNKLGVCITIDDFGTGYSSLSYLKQFPIKTLKIDHSFIQDIPDDAGDVALTQAIIAMARSLDINVVAEGVETVEQLKLLVDLQCNEMQGFYFSKPLATATFTQLLQENRSLDLSKIVELQSQKKKLAR